MPLEFEIKLEVDVNIAQLEEPPKELLSTEDGLECNNDYTDFRWLGWAEWKKSFPIEKRYLLQAESKSRTLKAFEDKLVNREEWLLQKSGIDHAIFCELGISSMVSALYAIGCYPIISCRGNPECEPNINTVPSVAFFSNKKTAKQLVQLATPTIGLFNADIEGFEGLAIYARRAMHLLEFSKVLYDNRKLFERK
ncbi:MAG: hypothetical protein V1866_07375 [archaeon]